MVMPRAIESFPRLLRTTVIAPPKTRMRERIQSSSLTTESATQRGLARGIPPIFVRPAQIVSVAHWE